MAHKTLIAAFFLLALALSPGMAGQEVSLGMSREDFINVFGKADKEAVTDCSDVSAVILFYGDDFFRFVDGRHARIRGVLQVIHRHGYHHTGDEQVRQEEISEE